MPAIDRFLEGFRRFQQQYYREDSELFDTLKEGQRPTTLLVGCCDSRVDPLKLTGCEPGELFIVRNVANLVPPCEKGLHHQGVSSALEYAVCVLAVERIIVLGHGGCGGIRALMQGVTHEQEEPSGGFLAKWLTIADPAREFVQTECADLSPDEQLTDRKSVV